jgi:hypothetical protein
LEDGNSKFKRKPIETQGRPYQDQFFADYLAARVKSEQFLSKRCHFVKCVLKIVDAMEKASFPVTIDDVCLCAAIHGPARLILHTLQRDPRNDYVGNYIMAAAAYFGLEDLVEDLLHDWYVHGVYWELTVIGDPVAIAAAQGHTRIMFMLLDNDKSSRIPKGPSYTWDYYKLTDKGDWSYFTGITRAAAQSGEVELLREYFRSRALECFTSYWWHDFLTVVKIAAANGHTDFVAFLMESRLIHETTTSEQRVHKAAILQKAAENGHEELVRWCISNSTPMELQERCTSQPRSAYAAAASGGYIDIMRLLPLGEYWKRYHLEGAMSRAAYHGRINVAQHILDEGFDLNANSRVWRPKPRKQHKSKAREAGKWVTPLLAAIENEQFEMVGFLLDRGLDLDRNPQLLQAALTMAEEIKNDSIVGILKAYSEPASRFTHIQGAITEWMKWTASTYESGWLLATGK